MTETLENITKKLIPHPGEQYFGYFWRKIFIINKNDIEDIVCWSVYY